MKTRQEIFDIVYNGLKSQDWQQSLNNNACMYRSYDGKKCAFGHLIPDDMYDPILENKSADRLLTGEDWLTTPEDESSVSEFLLKFWDWAKLEFQLEDIDFIQRMQHEHDEVGNAYNMQKRFEILAKEYGLIIPA